MLGFALALIGFKLENKNVWEQFKTAPGMHLHFISPGVQQSFKIF